MTTKNSILILVVFAYGLFMQSCTIAKISGKGAVPVLLNQPSEQMQLVEHIPLKRIATLTGHLHLMSQK